MKNDKGKTWYCNGLRGALQNLCYTDQLFEPLWASFIIVSSESSDRLNISPVSFPTYTRHDYKHAMNVVAKMEMLIGEDRLALLMPTDIWLLLMCAFTHDWGMTVSLADLIEHINNGNLDRHLERMKGESKGVYSRAAHELDPKQIKAQLKAAKGKSGRDIESVLSAINSQRSLMLVLQSYFRTYHADGYGNALNERTFPGVAKRLQVLVAQINKTHIGDWSDVMNLPQSTDGFATEHAHPRFISAMLRLADLLDVDSGRVNPYQVRIVENPDDSLAHQEKHLAVEQLLTSPQRIGAIFNFDTVAITRHYEEYGEGAVLKAVGHADYDDEASFRSTQIRAQAAKLAFAWYDMLTDELKDLASAWNEIVPEGYSGSAPIAGEDDFSVKFDGEEVKPKDLDLRYELNYVRAFDIIRGAGLYTDRLTFIRELIQNAMDAQKIQLFVDWENKNVKSQKDIMLDRFFSNLPYDLWDAAVHVEVETIKTLEFGNSGEGERIILRVSDNGTGISREKLRKMRYVGSIYDPEIEQIKERMPEWLKPTGSFGIGMQSVFDFQKQANNLHGEFTMYTKSAMSNEALKVTFRANQTDGEIFPENNNKRLRYGTDVEVELTDHSDVILRLFDKSGVDKFSSKGERIAPLIRQYLEETIRGDIVPLVFCATVRERGEKPTEEMRSANRSKEEQLINNVFRDAFPHIFEHADDRDHDYFRPVFSDNTGTPTLGFWQWNHEHKILICASIKNRVAAIKRRGSVTETDLSGRASFTFRGIRVDKPARQEREAFRFTNLPTPWCDASVFVMGGDAGELLAINRESFLDKINANASKVEEMESHTIDTLRMGFEKLLFYLADGTNEDTDWDKMDEYLAENPAAAVLLALASHCIYKKTIDKHAHNKKNNEMVVIDGNAARKYKKAFMYLQGKLELARTSYTTDVLYYDSERRHTLEKTSIGITQFLRDIDNIWFTTHLPYVGSSFERDELGTGTPIRICEDILANIPVRLYWSDVFYIKKRIHSKITIKSEVMSEYVQVPTPVYKYCSVVQKSFNLSKEDKEMLFIASREYGEMQAALHAMKSAKTDFEQSEDYKALSKLFGERHVFPSLPEYEKVATPYEKMACPHLLEHCGYVLLSPLTPLVFADRVIEVIPVKLKDWVEKWQDKWNNRWTDELLNIFKRNLVWYTFTGKCKSACDEIDAAKVIDQQYSRVLREAEHELYDLGRPVGEDPYGLIKLIEYVRDLGGRMKPREEYEQTYIDFLVDYLNL